MDCLDEEPDLLQLLNELSQYDFDFENLAFEGGGAKMASYVGAIQVLERIGVLQKCTRFAGTSGGSIIAMCLSVELLPKQIQEYMSLQFKELLLDSRFGAMSLLPNILKNFGWNPATRFNDTIKGILERHTGNANITFREVYRRYKKVLCVVATNVSTMSVEYFHTKTTPDVPVAVAVRASLALPGYIQPVRYVHDTGLPQFYCDGGLVCNFPIHCFDGWYLSMTTENSFFNKLGQDDNPFDEFNPKTLGLLLYTAWEGELMQGELHQRYKNHPIKRPHTPLAKSRRKKCDEILSENEKTHEMVQAGRRFLQTLREVDVDKDCEISLREFKAAFDKISFDDCDEGNELQIKSSDVELLFGKDFNFEQAFQEIDKDTDGKITFDEFLWFMQRKGIRFRALLEGGNMMQITTFGQFFEVAFNTVLTMTRKVYYKKEDPFRTVGIYTDYVDTTDFALTPEDKQFMIRQGVIACLVYFHDLLEKATKGQLPTKMSAVINRKSVVRNSPSTEPLSEQQVRLSLDSEVKKASSVDSNGLSNRESDATVNAGADAMSNDISKEKTYLINTFPIEKALPESNV